MLKSGRYRPSAVSFRGRTEGAPKKQNPRSLSRSIQPELTLEKGINLEFIQSTARLLQQSAFLWNTQHAIQVRDYIPVGRLGRCPADKVLAIHVRKVDMLACTCNPWVETR